MANVLERVIDYVRENPTAVASVCLAVLIIGVTQAVVSAALGGALSSGVLSDKYAKFPLIAKTRVSHNSWLYRFALPSDSARLGLPLGQHVSLRTTVGDREIRRPYTPVSSIDTKGHFELLVKTYPAPYGLMSRHLESLSLGDTVEACGPRGKFKYNRGTFNRLCMVAGGTGITPMWQVLDHILGDPSDKTKISLVYANVTEDDILLREELDNLVNTHRDQFDVFYVLNDPPSGWNGGVGFVTEEILQKRFGEARTGALALMCGPPPMNKAMKVALTKLGYKDSQLFKF